MRYVKREQDYGKLNLKFDTLLVSSEWTGGAFGCRGTAVLSDK